LGRKSHYHGEHGGKQENTEKSGLDEQQIPLTRKNALEFLAIGRSISKRSNNAASDCRCH
jgi:hypothetical protein